MEIKNVCRTVMELYLMADSVKKIHYTTESNHTHELCDDVRDAINEFADEFAEQMFGYMGKPSFSDFPELKSLDVPENDDIGKVCVAVPERIEAVRSEVEGDPKLSGTVSLIDDFKGKMQKLSFLCTFDKMSSYRRK